MVNSKDMKDFIEGTLRPLSEGKKVKVAEQAKQVGGKVSTLPVVKEVEVTETGKIVDGKKPYIFTVEDKLTERKAVFTEDRVIKELSKLEDGSVDLIFFDPFNRIGDKEMTFSTPAARDKYIQRVQGWIVFAHDKLRRNGGNMVIGANVFSISSFGNNIFPEDSTKRLLTWFSETERGELPTERGYIPTTIPFIWGVKGTPWVFNLEEGEKFFTGEFNFPKGKERCRKELIRSVLHRFSNEGQTVLEIMGKGTPVEEIAGEMGRNYVTAFNPVAKPKDKGLEEESVKKYKGFKYASLFSGIGGFEQALGSLGGECIFSSEIDKFASQSYKAIYGGDKLHGDITKVNAEDVPNHDVLVGGFPCQSFSVAGKQEGFDDTRGTLFFDIARITQEKRPKVLLLENVKGLVNHGKGNTLKTMLKTLNKIGYVVDMEILNTKYFNIPHQRERVFIVAVREDLIDVENWNVEGTTVIPKAKKRLGEVEGLKTFNFEYPKQIGRLVNLRNILEEDVEDIYYLTEEKATALMGQFMSDGNPGTAMSLTVSGGRESGRNLEISGVYAVLTPDRIEKRQNGRRFKDNDEVSFTLTAQDRQGVVILYEGGDGNKLFTIRNLTPRECWRLQGFTDEAFDKVRAAGLSDSQLYKQAGNAVTVDVIRAVAENLLKYLK